MESIKNKLGILVLILCFGIIIAIIGYCLFGLSDGSQMMEGTLVKGVDTLSKMMPL